MLNMKMPIRKHFSFAKHYEKGNYRKFNDLMVRRQRYSDLETFLYFLKVKGTECKSFMFLLRRNL